MLIHVTERFALLRSVTYSKWRHRRRLAIVEHATKAKFQPAPYGGLNVFNISFRIDPRSKKIKSFIKIWDIGIASRQGGRMLSRIQHDAIKLVDKLERLWPMHFTAKELKQRPIYMKNILNEREKAFVLAVTPRLIQPAQTYMKELGHRWDHDAEYRKNTKRKLAAIKHKVAETKRLHRSDNGGRRRNPEAD